MPHTGRYRRPSLVENAFARLHPFAALREKFREGYTRVDLRADVQAGLVVALVAVPLGMALAIASGVAPQFGLYTVIIAGAIVALLGGSRCQVTGPTAAFVVILAPIAQKFGFSGLLVAGLMAGLMLVLMGVSRMGRLIQYIPHPVTTGFTSGIAVVIATLQIKDFFGLQTGPLPEHYTEKVVTLVKALPSFSVMELAVGVFTLSLLLIWPRLSKKIPAPLIALGAATILTVLARKFFPSFDVATIGSRFGGIPQAPPHFDLPWSFTASGSHDPGAPLTFDLLKSLVPSAFAIAMLGAIESLLSAVVADGMAGTKHDPDAELVALGTGNIIAPFFGGIAATGAIARTATNIRFGARSPIASITHAFTALLIVLLFAPYVSYLPMAALAALLLLVAYNMSEMKHFAHILKVAPKSDVIVLLICFSLTVLFDMVVGVTVGIVLAALLFMRRMAELTSSQLMAPHAHPRIKDKLPDGVVIYEIAGPLFFGAAKKAVEAIETASREIRTLIFVMDQVPVMDVTGLVALESAIRKLSHSGRKIILVGVKTQPTELLKKAGLIRENQIELCPDLECAVSKAV